MNNKPYWVIRDNYAYLYFGLDEVLLAINLKRTKKSARLLQYINSTSVSICLDATKNGDELRKKIKEVY